MVGRKTEGSCSRLEEGEGSCEGSLGGRGREGASLHFCEEVISASWAEDPFVHPANGSGTLAFDTDNSSLDCTPQDGIEHSQYLGVPVASVCTRRSVAVSYPALEAA